MNIIFNWLLRAVVVLITAYLVPGFVVADFGAAMVLVLVISLFNILVKPLLLLLTLPINFLTLGLFTLVVNAVVLQIAINVVPGVSSRSFGTTLLVSIVMALLSMAVGRLK